MSLNSIYLEVSRSIYKIREDLKYIRIYILKSVFCNLSKEAFFMNEIDNNLILDI